MAERSNLRRVTDHKEGEVKILGRVVNLEEVILKIGRTNEEIKITINQVKCSKKKYISSVFN